MEVLLLVAVLIALAITSTLYGYDSTELGGHEAPR